MHVRTLAATAVLALAATPPAHAGPDVRLRTAAPVFATATFPGGGVAGMTCGLVATADPADPSGPESGILYSGPVAAPAGVTVVCTVQVGSPYHGTTGAVRANDAAAASASGTGTMAVPPAPVAYAAARADDVYVCTEWQVGGVAQYYDAVGAAFRPLPDTTRCAPAERLTTTATDPVVCAVLDVLFPPAGDVPGVWECPPY